MSFNDGIPVLMPYIDGPLLVADQQVAQEASLGHVSKQNHVIHSLHRCRMHDPERGLLLQRDNLLLSRPRGIFRHVRRFKVLLMRLFTFPSSSTSNRLPDGVILTRAPMGTPMSESTHTHSSWKHHGGKETLTLMNWCWGIVIAVFR